MSSEFSFESIEGEIDESEMSFAIYDWFNGEDKILSLISYLNSASGKDYDGNEVYITNDNIQLISLSEIDTENLSIELLYDNGSKKELMKYGKSEYLADYDSITDSKVNRYYYKWDFIKLEDIKDIVKVNITDNKTSSSWTMDIKLNERNSEEKNGNDYELIKMRKANIDADTLVVSPDIIYADENFIMLSDYYGMIIYTRYDESIRATLDLNYIGCNYIQGDNYYDIKVSEDGEKIYLHPYNENVLYVYDWKADIVRKREYMDDFMQKDNVSDKKEINSSVVTDTGIISQSSIKLDDNKKVYLSCEGGKLKNLKWVVEDENGNKDSGFIFNTDDLDF